jgi:hypothetical protein
MGIENYFFKNIHSVISRNDTKSKKKVLSLGHPDLLLDKDFLQTMYDDNFIEKIPEDKYHVDIRKLHNRDSNFFIYDPYFIFEQYNYELYILDVKQHRGNEILVDLNYQIDQQYYEYFDLILDGGTLEHCYNISQAFKNVCQMIKVGGFSLHSNPVNRINHGYFNLNPLFYDHGFKNNGFDIHDLCILDQTQCVQSIKEIKGNDVS